MPKRYVDTPPSFKQLGVNVPFCAGVQCDGIIYLTGQVAQDYHGEPIHPGNLVEQSRIAMEGLTRVLAEYGATMDDVVKRNTYYAESSHWKESADIQASYFSEGCVSTDVVISALVKPGFVIEIEAIAMPGSPKTFVKRHPHHPFAVHGNFRDGVRAGDFIYLGDHVGANDAGALLQSDMPQQASVMMENIEKSLKEVGASIDDLVKMNIYYVGLEGWTEALRVVRNYFREPPTLTAVGVPSLMLPGFKIQADGIAMVNQPKVFADPPGHYPWPSGVPFHWGVRCGRMVYISGEVAMNRSAQVLFPGDMSRQTHESMEQIKNLLSEMGANADDVLRKNTFYVGLDDTNWKESAAIRGTYFKEGPCATGFAVEHLGAPGLTICMEAVAMRDE